MRQVGRGSQATTALPQQGGRLRPAVRPLRPCRLHPLVAAGNAAGALSAGLPRTCLHRGVGRFAHEADVYGHHVLHLEAVLINLIPAASGYGGKFWCDELGLSSSIAAAHAAPGQHRGKLSSAGSAPRQQSRMSQAARQATCCVHDGPTAGCALWPQHAHRMPRGRYSSVVLHFIQPDRWVRCTSVPRRRRRKPGGQRRKSRAM